MVPCAIIGLACLFPGAPDLARFWGNIEGGVDAITEVPDGRWDKQFYDPNSADIDRFYCRRGGFVDDYADFDPLAFGVVPKLAASVEPDQLLTLKIGYDALRDAGYAERPFARARTGVVLGRGNYVGAGVLHLQQHVRLLPQMLQTLHDLFPGLPQAALDTAKLRLKQQFSYYGPDAAAGMIPNLLASRLANRLDLHGPAYTIDAACASSLIAVEQACAALAHGGMDMMLAGGVHLTHDLTFWATFCQLGALSRAGVARPFSREADGILAGEGIGVAVLKRLDDAVADGDRIYAVIEGVASSSDGRGGSLVSPAASGQLVALEKAWAQAGLPRDAIGLLEAHGTGTPAGDAVELETLRAFFGTAARGAERPVVGSVKSMIGHAMPASGMASLIKAALAIHHGVLPPTLHCEDPNPRLQETRFRVIGEAEPWACPAASRVAAVNAFGFGGINAHLVLRGAPAAASLHSFARPACGLPKVLLVAAETPAAMLAILDAGEPFPADGRGPCRLAILAPDAARMATARRAVAAGKPWHGRQNIYFSPGGLASGGGKLAFVFPGVGSSFNPQLTGLAAYFGATLPPHCEALDPAVALPRVVAGLLGFNRYLYDRLCDLGLHADHMAGHSIGEWSAMVCAGMVKVSLADLLAAGLDLDAVQFPDLQFLSAACGDDAMQAFLRGLQGVTLSHDNCPHQVIACGGRDAIGLLAARLAEARVLHQILPIISGFHSPLFAAHTAPYEAFFANAAFSAPGVPVWSATSAAIFPESTEARRQLAIDHLVKPVRFRAMIEAMYAAGVRVFVEVGTGALSGMVADTLAGKPHLAIAANREDRGGLAQLQHVSAALWVEGADFDTRLLGADRRENVAPSASSMRLALGVKLVRVSEPLEPWLLPAGASAFALAASPANANDPLHNAVRDTLAEIERAGRDVLALWRSHRERKAEPSAPRRISLRVSRLLDIETTIPYVKDHELYPQRPGWKVTADRRPVVPLTMEIMLVREALEAALPDMKVVEVRHVQAYKWLEVSAPVTVEIVLESRADGWIDAEIEGYFRAEFSIAGAYPQAVPAAPAALIGARPAEADPVSLYADRWMFHGPAYRGVIALHGIGENGIDGALRVPPGKGALLDNMGQLAGYWVMEQPENCLAMPIGIGRLRFFGPDPAVGEQMQAQIRMTRIDALNCVSDHQLRDASGRLSVTIEGWHTRRYVMDRGFSTRTRNPGKCVASREVARDVMLFEDVYDTAMLRDYISRTYLTESERATYDTLPPRGRRAWLAGRVAAKDAVLNWVRRERDLAEVFPQEVIIANDAAGKPLVRPHLSGNVSASLCISIAHKRQFAAAMVAERAVGIDIEMIEPRTEGFLAMAFAAGEHAMLGDDDAATGFTRLWAAKEVAAKRAGTGLRGRPQDFVVEQREGDNVFVDGHWIETRQINTFILGWSRQDHFVEQVSKKERLLF